jgi:hypothetical protein
MIMPTSSTDYSRRILMHDQAKKLRKSPNTSAMYSIHIPILRMTVYSKTLKKQKESLKKFHELYPKYRMISESPTKDK